MDSYTIINGKKYRKGYTTGSCAAAASKAAVMMLLKGMEIAQADIDTPAGIRLILPVSDTTFFEESVECAVVKDGGDDPDVTTGLKIYARVRLSNEKGIRVIGGEGVGTVTLPGLRVPVGQPAINPVPMKMIIKEVSEVLPEGMGADIVIRVPGGEEIAVNTYNPRLGIIGGISILGTKGIVEPMSEEAWKESLALELGILSAKGIKQIVFTFGNYGNDFITKRFGVEDKYIVTISNFVGFMLEKALENHFERILMVGHMGKLVKVAAGIFHTHSRVADARMETIASYAALEGAQKDVIEKIFASRTTDAAAEIIEVFGLQNVYERIVRNVSARCREFVFNKIEIGTVLFNKDNNLLDMDDMARKILKSIGSSYE
ncbi:MAG: cobalt-precorrin-5B (C(1))-methyltransferase CbiD [Bacillota bacterium]